MLSIEALPILLKIISKLDMTPIIEKLKNVDIFSEPEAKDGKTAKENAKKQLSREKIGVIGMEIFAEITPQLGKIADDIPPLIAAYKNVTIEEAKKLDAAEIINEIIYDEGIITFFKRALRKKVEL